MNYVWSTRTNYNGDTARLVFKAGLASTPFTIKTEDSFSYNTNKKL